MAWRFWTYWSSRCPHFEQVFWRKSRACTYVPWGVNLPRHIKCSWVRGECIRYFSICSHERFYILCLARLTTALELLDYPKDVVAQMTLLWHDRSRVITPSRERVEVVDKSECSLSQVKSQEHGVLGGVGSVGIPRVHVLRAWHHSAVQLSWPRVVHCIAKRLPFSKGNIKLFAILRPLASLHKLFMGHVRIALKSN